MPTCGAQSFGAVRVEFEGLKAPIVSVTYSFYVALRAIFPTIAVDHCTLLHGGAGLPGRQGLICADLSSRELPAARPWILGQ